MLFISKFLAIIAYPMGLSCFLACGTIVLMLLKKKRSALVCGLLSFSIILVFSSPVVSYFLVESLESKFIQQADVPKASAIVLLGGFTRPALPPRRYVEIGPCGDRMHYAVRLFKEHRAPFIVCTGAKITFLTDYPGTEASCMASLLKDLWGIDSSSIIIEDKALNTHDHGPRVRAIFEQRGIKKNIILVTSATHMYRSVKVFKKCGFTVIPAPADFWEERGLQMNIFLLLPSAEALSGSTAILHEYYGIVMYWIMGWLQ
jgi:uncharacterized SAM-binding protein YcdF (DUF218 family)